MGPAIRVGARTRACIGGVLLVLSMAPRADTAAIDALAKPAFAALGQRYVIDVRTEAEWLQEHVPGAVLIPHDRIAHYIEAAIPDRRTPIALYCRSGGRSGQALRTLRALGYTNVVNYGGVREARAHVASARDCSRLLGAQRLLSTPSSSVTQRRSRPTKGRCLLAIALAGSLIAAGATTPQDLQALDRELARTHEQIEALLRLYTERHPDVRRLQAALADLRERRNALAATLPAAAPPAAPGPAAAGVPTSQSAPPSAAAPAPARPALGVSRTQRRVRYIASFKDLCAQPGVLTCFDFNDRNPMSGRDGVTTGQLTPGSDGKVRARIYRGSETRGGATVRMDFEAEDGASHGAFAVTMDAFGEGDRLVLQWRQWFSPELITRFSETNEVTFPRIGGDGPKQAAISEIGDTRGCTFSEVVASNPGWAGPIGIYHGCGLWFRPRIAAPIGPRDASDYDVQPGGDVVCRYRFMRRPDWAPRIDYLYPTVPANLYDAPYFNAAAAPDRYLGCLGWEPNQWMTFRIELDIAFCRQPWSELALPQECAATRGRIRYWVKYANEDTPWLVTDFPMPIRWHADHSERFGRFTLLPYNTNEQPRADKPRGFTLYDDVLIARNVEDLPWERD